MYMAGSSGRRAPLATRRIQKRLIKAPPLANVTLRSAIDAAKNRCASPSGGVTCSVTETHALQHPVRWVGYNWLVPKRHCTSRAEWRLQPGKPAEPLSTHYRLDCDYGTAVITLWEDGGREPIYVCENHAKRLGPSRERSSDVRVITAQSDLSDDPTGNADRTPIQEVADTKAKSTTSSEAARTLVDTKAATAATAPAAAAVSAAPMAPVAATAPAVATAPVAATVAAAPAKAPLRDLTYGNAAKAMVDEVIWNLAAGNPQVYRTALQQGMSAADAAQAAGGQVAVVHRKISDYTLKLEAVLAESKAVIDVAEAIDKPLEQAMLEIIGNGAMSDLEKDAAIQQLGALQEWVKHGLRGSITPLEAQQIILAIGDRQNWGGPADISNDLKAVYRAIYGSLKTAIRSAVPEAQDLHERLINLYAAKSELEIR
jgi:hypothetical protein